MGFRSDNDLYQWRAAMAFAVPPTTISFGVLQAMGLAFRYSPVAVLPAICLLAFVRFRSWRDRRLGRRFSHYDADDLG